MSKHQIKKGIGMDGSKAKIAIILSEFNIHIGEELLKNTVEELKRCGTKKIEIIRVPGALEIPLTAQKIIEKKSPDAVIALGVIIKGQTSHYEHVSRESINGLMTVSLLTGTPIIQGILTVLNEKQAKKRIVLGKEYAQTALSIIKTFSSL
ncbi:6,7-dimethyl-8-ribityllumazine synthase [bacterium]|nr:6,7-dimethyl-8-ribityllumazine synthase [bacterium]